MKRIIAIFLVMTPSAAWAGMSFSLSGFTQKSNLGLQSQRSQSISGTGSVDLMDFLRVGLTHRQRFEQSTGYEETDAESGLRAFDSDVHQISNSLDLTLILYSGQVMMPYITGGVVVKSYDIQRRVEGAEDSNLKLTLPPQPSGGVGVAFRINRNFSLKVTYTVSPGIKEDLDGVSQGVLDSYSEVGITYRL